MVDGVDVNEEIALDESQLSHQLSGMWHYCTDAKFVGLNDTVGTLTSGLGVAETRFLSYPQGTKPWFGQLV